MNNTQKLIIAQRELIKALRIKKLRKKIKKLEKKIIEEEVR